MPYSQEELHAKFKKISSAVMKVYHDEMHDFLEDAPEGSLTDAEVAIMIMNLTIGSATNIYYSLKKFLPKVNLDFPFMRAKLINEMSATFEKIKDYNVKDQLIQLTPEQIKEIQEKGSTTIKNESGDEEKITMKDLMVSRKEADAFLNKAKEVLKDADTPKIIVPGC